MEQPDEQPGRDAGAEPTRSRRRGIATIVAAGVVAGGLAVGLAALPMSGVVPAGAQDAAVEPGPGDGPGLRLEHRRGRGPHPGHMLKLGGRAVHGEFVTRTDDGFRTIATQRGAVVAASATSIEVRSEDGFTRRYAVDGETRVRAGADGVAGLAPDDEVHVIADVDGDTATARTIVDVTGLEERMAKKLERQEGGPQGS